MNSNTPNTGPHHADGPFPAWRLPNPVRNETTKRLEAVIDSCGLMVKWSVLLIVAALCLEVGIAWFHPPFDSWLNRWGSACATFLVAIGVFAEFRFSERGSKCQEELARRSNERAAYAVLQAEKLREALAWRTLESEQRRVIATRLKEHSGSLVVFRRVGMNPEVTNFAIELAHPFMDAGWKVAASFENVADEKYGVLIPNEAGPAPLVIAARRAFEAADLEYSAGWFLEGFPRDAHLAAWPPAFNALQRGDENLFDLSTALSIWIFPKPMTKVE